MYQERAHQEVRDKLYDMGLHQREVEQGIAVLIEEGYINEERFAIAFAGGKFRTKQWGRVKIRHALKAKHISDYCMKKALNAIDDDEYMKTLSKVLAARFRSTSEKNLLKKKYNVARYAISRGFESDLVWDALNEQFPG